MTFLKWYTFAIILLAFLLNLYRTAKQDQIGTFIFYIIYTTPILIYIFMSKV